MALTDYTGATYRYFVVNLVTNRPIAEIPFKGVSYEKVLTGAGTFSGDILSSPETANLALYETTMPGRTGLYVVRNGVCVWGGIIWSRSYNVNERVLRVSASEFTSYFHHRRIWKTWGQVFEADLEVTNELVKVTLSFGSGYTLAEGSTVRFVFIGNGNEIYTGTYTVLAEGDVINSQVVPQATKKVFYVKSSGFNGKEALPSIPSGNYSLVTVYARTNTYDYVRSILSAMSNDFSDIEFANTEIAPGKIVTENVAVKRITNGFAILQTEAPSNLVPGQEVELRNVDPLVDGKRNVSSVRGNIVTINSVGGLVLNTAISNRTYEIASFESRKTGPQSSIVTVTTTEPHNIVEGSLVDVANLDLPDSSSRTLNVTRKLIEEEPEEPNVFSYTINRGAEFEETTVSKATATVESVSSIISRTQVEAGNADDEKIASITTLEPHGFVVGQSVTISNLKYHGTVVKYRVNSVFPLVPSGDTPDSFDYFTRVKTPFATLSNVNVSGFVTTANIISRSMFISGSNALFFVTTSVPHGATVGKQVYISGMKDSYGIRSYSFSTANNIATFFTGTPTDNLNHNIQATNASGSFTVSGLPSVKSFAVNFIEQKGEKDGSTLTLTTNVASNLKTNDRVVVRDINRDIPKASFIVKRVSRVNNVTTITTYLPHNLKVGDTFTYGGNKSVGKQTTGTFKVKSVSGEDKFSYDNPVESSIQTFTGSSTLKCQESWTWEPIGRGRRTSSISGSEKTTALDTMYQGNPQDGFGREVGAARFQSLASRLPAGVSLSNIKSITSLSTRLVRRKGVGSSNNATLYLGLHGSSDLAQSNPDFPPVGLAGAVTKTSTGWKKGATRTISLPTSWRKLFLDGTARGLIIGLQTPTDGYYTGSPFYMGIFGEGAEDNEPTITVNYTYENLGSNFRQTGNNLGTVTTAYSGYDGTYTLSEDSVGTSIKLFNPRGRPTNGTVDVSGTVTPLSQLNKTYRGDEIISKTANSITVQAPDIGVNVSSSSIISTFSPKITENSIFNAPSSAPEVVSSVIDSTTFGYIKTGTYNLDIPIETINPVGKIAIPDEFLNKTGIPETDEGLVIGGIELEDGLYRVKILGYPESSLPLTDVTNNVIIEGDSHLNGTYEITSTQGDHTFQFKIDGEYDTYESLPVYGYAEASNQAVISYGTYGSFTASSDLDFDFFTTGNSDTNVLPESFRGFELTNIGEELEKYTDRLEGFDYRVDCFIDPAENSFKREFVVVPVFPTAVREYIDSQANGQLPAGEAVPIKYFGADKLVFEFPGNISDLQLEESAENAVTRFFMVGNIGDLGEDVSQPYVAIADTELLNPENNSYPWPLLDDDDSSNTIFDEDELYSYAERYMRENKPPAGAFSIVVNGSIEPIVGSYAPGDWCSLIINDDFVKQRLSSELEPRGDILLRKIDSYSVEVPDSVTFPEKITLQLLPEWQVDKRGK
jgi:hypothetical protein